MVIQILGASTPGVIGSVKVLARHLTHDPLVARMSFERNQADDLVNVHLHSVHPENVWHRLTIQLYRIPAVREVLANRWIVISEGTHGWQDYAVLAHVDRRVRISRRAE
jgi:hypothetical protein